MSLAQYFVVVHEDEWKIKYEGQHYGPFATRQAAIWEAVEAAHTRGQKGQEAQVLVQGVNNQFRVEWTYGHDPYPPSPG